MPFNGSDNGRANEGKYVKIVQGKELNIRLASEIATPGNLLYPAYQQAMKALQEIVNQTKSFLDELKGNEAPCHINDLLARYNGNIIAFEAQRGYGKTQTMLSFSSLLEKSNKNAVSSSCFNDVRFVVLPMIAPSAMEEDQKLLYVILSRFYNYAQKMAECLPYDNDRLTLSSLLQKCLSGINGFKRLNHSGYDSACDDFETLQDVSDGMALRNHFWELLHFFNQHNGEKKTFFVIQLDDVDSQIKYGYQIMDDIRKYLVIPNLIILISTDGDLLYRAILEEHLNQFKRLREVDPQQIASMLSKISKKYIDKLIPPSHMVHLPRIEQYLGRGVSELKLYYLAKDLNITSCSLAELQSASVFPWEKDMGWDLENVLFRAIYEKTGLAFAKHSNYMHNIIPQSLRGLSQLLYLLKEMEEVPPINNDSFKSEKAYLEAWKARIARLEMNLALFESYFINEWLDAKITRIDKERNDREFLRNLNKAPKDDRIKLAIDYLTDSFWTRTYQHRQNELLVELQGVETELTILKNPRKEENKRKKFELEQSREKIKKKLADITNRKPGYSRSSLDRYMLELSKLYKENENYLLFFSIHVIMDLESHILVLNQRKRAIEDRLNGQKEKDGKISESGFNHYLAFDFDPLITCLPPTCLTPGEAEMNAFTAEYISCCFKPVMLFPKDCENTIKSKYEYRTEKVNDEQAADVTTQKYYKSIRDSLFAPTENEGEYLLSVFNFAALLLNLGKTYNPIPMEKDEAMQTQKRLFLFQELALFIMGNWDVQEKIYKYLLPMLQKNLGGNKFAEYNKRVIRESTGTNLCSFIFSGIDGILNEYFSSLKDYLFRTKEKPEEKRLSFPEDFSCDEILGNTFIRLTNKNYESKAFFTITAFEAIFSALFFKDFDPANPDEQKEYSKSADGVPQKKT